MKWTKKIVIFAALRHEVGNNMFRIGLDVDKSVLTRHEVPRCYLDRIAQVVEQ